LQLAEAEIRLLLTRVRMHPLLKNLLQSPLQSLLLQNLLQSPLKTRLQLSRLRPMSLLL
jgi:hypothetical protein